MAAANDQFELYYAEKLWEMIPAIYRHEDGLAENPGVLRALIEVIAEQAAILRRSQDRLWEDAFIDSCNEWAVPYIGELVATRLLPEQLKRGRRIDVAKTIYYRRRKGTVPVLEELISDITGWDGKLVEGFKRLVRARHGLDAKPASLAGKYSGTMPGGCADIRNLFAAGRTNGPFDEYFHTPDVRKPRGLDGLYGINRLNFYLYNLQSYHVTDVTPFALGSGKFTFDPSGRSIQLFNGRKLRDRKGWSQWQAAAEWDLPVPIKCRLLGQAAYRITEEVIQNMQAVSAAASAELRALLNLEFRDEQSLKRLLDVYAPTSVPLGNTFFLPLLKHSIINKCGKNQLQPSAIAVTVGAAVVATENILAANLLQTVPPAITRELAIDAENGLFLFSVLPVIPTASYHYGFSGPVGAGTYSRPAVEDSEPTVIPVMQAGGPITTAHISVNGVAQIDDNKTYNPVSNISNIRRMVLQAANRKRPYLRLNQSWILTADNSLSTDAIIVLDGLWIGSAGNRTCNIILRGDYESVTIRNCTLDPGGSINAALEDLRPLTLFVEGNVEKLCIEQSITGPVAVRNNGFITTLVICNSIVQSVTSGAPAIDVGLAETQINSTTIFGTVNVHRLHASDTIITETVIVTDNQKGCFRFSAAPKDSRLPRPYESFLFTQGTHEWFNARRFGHPAFAQLTAVAPLAVRTGGENNSEIGVFNNLLNPVRTAGLKTKVDEYMPFGLVPSFITEHINIKST